MRWFGNNFKDDGIKEDLRCTVSAAAAAAATTDAAAAANGAAAASHDNKPKQTGSTQVQVCVVTPVDRDSSTFLTMELLQLLY